MWSEAPFWHRVGERVCLACSELCLNLVCWCQAVAQTLLLIPHIGREKRLLHAEEGCAGSGALGNGLISEWI